MGFLTNSAIVSAAAGIISGGVDHTARIMQRARGMKRPKL